MTGWRRWRRTAAVSSDGQWRWWPASGALVTGGEVRSGGNLGGKTRGGGAHREAEVPERGLASLQCMQGG
jgi:hypothetical protein